MNTQEKLESIKQDICKLAKLYAGTVKDLTDAIEQTLNAKTMQLIIRIDLSADCEAQVEHRFEIKDVTMLLPVRPSNSSQSVHQQEVRFLAQE